MIARDACLVEELRARATLARRRATRMVHEAGVGHPLGDLFAVDIP